MDYSFMFFYDNEDYVINDIESFFLRFNIKINAYRKQFTQTVELYEKSYNDEIKKNNKSYKKALELADVEYTKLFNEIVGSDDLKHQYAAHFSGISQLQDNLRDFEESLMDLYSEMKANYFKSAVIQVYSLLETNLNGICAILQEFQNSTVSIDSLMETDYQQRAKNYLRKTTGLNMSLLNTHNPSLKSIQTLRNTLVHSLDSVHPKKLATIREIVENSNGELHLAPNFNQYSVHITGPNYLYNCYEKITNYFYDLFWLIEEKFDFIVNKNRLSNLVSYISPKISIKNIKSNPQTGTDPTTGNKTILVILEFDQDDVSKISFNMEISYSNADSDKIEVSTTAELIENPDLNRLHDMLTKQSYTILGQMLSVFFITGKPKFLKVTIS